MHLCEFTQVLPAYKRLNSIISEYKRLMRLFYK